MSGGEVQLQLDGLCKQFATGLALEPTTIQLAPRERLILFGPSGCGKSTLLRLIAGLEPPTGGRVWVGGRDVTHAPPHTRGVALLPQRAVLYPHRRVGEQVPSDSAVWDMLRLHRLRDRWPEELSGGERQRVALARVIAQNRPILLLDEPFSPLDPAFRAEFRHDLHLLLEQFPATMLIVTHDPSDAWFPASRVGIMEQGQLRQVGWPSELVDPPMTRFTAASLARYSLLEGRVGGGESAGVVFLAADGTCLANLPESIRQRLGPAATHNLTLGIRPDDVSLQLGPMPPATMPPAPPQAIVGTNWLVVSAEPVGSGWLATLMRGRHRLRVAWPSSTPPRYGDPVTWQTPITLAQWYDHHGHLLRAVV